jgi:hypothetical protein
VLVAADGRWAGRPLESAKWKDGLGAAAFRFSYVASAASFVRRRKAPAAPGTGAARSGDGPARLAPYDQAAGRVALLHLGVSARLDFDAPQATDAGGSLPALIREAYQAATVVVPAPERSGRPAGLPRGEAPAALAEAFALSGVDGVVVSLVGAAPRAELLDRFYANVLDKKMPPAAALHEARTWARGRKDWAVEDWASLVYYGAR